MRDVDLDIALLEGSRDTIYFALQREDWRDGKRLTKRVSQNRKFWLVGGRGNN